MFILRYQTPPQWAQIVLKDFDFFLQDHAAAEKKAAGMATSMLSHYPDRKKLVEAMLDLAIEEMAHFRSVVKIMHERDVILGKDGKDPYVNAFRKHMRKGTDVYFLDRLLIAGIIEARGCERFGMVGEALPEGKMKQFYQAIAESEGRHNGLFYDLAKEYFSDDIILPRMNELLDIEADIVKNLPLTSALH
jgi:tRNA-(ms[2]io[6]A)-hydroxylase